MGWYTDQKLWPECDKSFTRTDALQKHMRVQHQESLPLSRKPPTKKRKVNKDDDAASSIVDIKKEDAGGPGGDDDDYEAPRTATHHQPEGTAEGAAAGGDPTAEQDDEDEEDEAMILDLFNGGEDAAAAGATSFTSPDQLRYAVALARYRYVISEHEVLLGELEMLRANEARVLEQKDQWLDAVLRKEIG
jgi:hypothetical protein